MAEKFNLGEALKRQEEFEGLGLEEKEMVIDKEQGEAEYINDEVKKGEDFSEGVVISLGYEYNRQKKWIEDGLGLALTSACPCMNFDEFISENDLCDVDFFDCGSIFKESLNKVLLEGNIESAKDIVNIAIKNNIVIDFSIPELATAIHDGIIGIENKVGASLSFEEYLSIIQETIDFSVDKHIKIDLTDIFEKIIILCVSNSGNGYRNGPKQYVNKIIKLATKNGVGLNLNKSLQDGLLEFLTDMRGCFDEEVVEEIFTFIKDKDLNINMKIVFKEGLMRGLLSGDILSAKIVTDLAEKKGVGVFCSKKEIDDIFQKSIEMIFSEYMQKNNDLPRMFINLVVKLTGGNQNDVKERMQNCFFHFLENDQVNIASNLKNYFLILKPIFTDYVEKKVETAKNKDAQFLERQKAIKILSDLVYLCEMDYKYFENEYKKYDLHFDEYLECMLEIEKSKEDEMEGGENTARKIFETLKQKAKDWKDEQNVTGPFRSGAEYFGYQEMFKYLNRNSKTFTRHDGLYNFREIVEVAKQSNLDSQEFYNNILAQVQKDDSAYEQGTAHHKLNNLVDNINLDFNETINEARKYSDIIKLQALLDDLDEPQKIFQSWKSLKKYEEICSLLGQREILDQLQTLKKEGKEKLYNYVETLAFHPNISMEKVMEFWKNPAYFLDVADEHTPEEIQNRKKPSNYFEFPNLDLTPEELRDALVEGAYDQLQVFRPLEIEYAIKKDGVQTEPEAEKSLKDLIFQAVGKRSEGKKGEAQDASALFTELNRFFKSKLQKVALMDYLKTEGAEEKFPQVAGFANEIRQILFDEKTGLKKKGETEEYRAKINLKSDPDGVVAGNDTACCMPFGSGKNNVYTFNPVCSLFTIQKKNSEGRWRTIAQSVLTKDKDIGQNIAKLRAKLEQEKAKMHEVVDESALLDKPRLIACDNIEVAQNFQGHPQKEEIVKTIYADFFQEYLKRFAKEDNLDEERVPIGLGYTDSLTTLPKENNTFIPEAPVGYSDKLHEQVFMLNVKKELLSGIIVKRAVNVREIKKSAEEKARVVLPKGISLLTFEDSLPVAYIEGKAYRDNESLMEYLHNMENALIAKDVNNVSKNRPNMSFKYTDSKGNIHGYILAYEGVVHKEENQYNDDGDYHAEDSDGEKVIYISDLASDGSRKAGGALIIGFTEAYKRNYVDKKNPLPILAQFRDKTSYQIILKQLEKLSKDVGMKFEMEELRTYEEGADLMHEIIIRPKV